MFRRSIRNPARKRFVKESKEVTVFVLEPSEVPYGSIGRMVCERFPSA